MVLSQRHSSLPRAQTAPLSLDIGRIAGMAAAMTLNIAALMLLLVPVSAPMPTTRIDSETPPPVWIERKKPQPKPDKPIEVRVVQPTTRLKPEIVRQPPTPQTVATQNDIVVPDGTEYVEPQVVERIVDETIGPPIVPVQAASSLEYATAPPPPYPRDALMDGLQGTVYLKVLVDVDGKPLSVEIQRSSGHRKLDDAAKRQVLKRWKFRPAMLNGQAIQVYGIVPVHFSLERQ
ncbi:MAG: TonB family protein [Xanthomonadaceae bacterium]|nr:TonB family protein [Xanthomonadaceae bacterium]